MLPFLKNKTKNAGIAGVIVKHREPDQDGVDETPKDESDPKSYIEACAHDLIAAVHARDAEKVAQVLKDTFDILESLPHDEVEHTEQGEG